MRYRNSWKIGITFELRYSYDIEVELITQKTEKTSIFYRVFSENLHFYIELIDFFAFTPAYAL